VLEDTEPYRSIIVVMARFQFTKPVEEGDLQVVAAHLRAAAPGCSVVVSSPWLNVVRVHVSDDVGHVYGREFIAR
jgi:hypothetical protein